MKITNQEEYKNAWKKLEQLDKGQNTISENENKILSAISEYNYKRIYGHGHDYPKRKVKT